jgi:tyrosyl-DNA phosphodiesterase 2
MGRDGLHVDIRDKSTVVRLCNTHLESLKAHPRLRPGQVELASQYLHAQFMDAGVIAGDFNAIEEFDRTLHTEYGLKDAYLENGGVEGSEDGYTWGMQSGESGRQYGFSRLDKVLFCGKIQVKNLRRFVAGIKIEVGEDEEVEGLGEGEGSETGQFITDHLGLMTDLYLERGSQLRV